MRNRIVVFVLFLFVGTLAMTLWQPADERDASPARAEAGAAVRSPVLSTPSSQHPRPGREDFVGSAVCAPCHKPQADAYLSSHHAKALVAPSAELAKARFDGAHFSSKRGGTTKFALREGSPVVITPAADSKVKSFPITYVSGVWPLEQYVVATERGKLQALGVVWDSRTANQGGSRWLHVYGRDGVAPSDPLFFTSAAQNWNHMCAECHSTWVERRYDSAADSFDTRWTELSVGCEACHGPGTAHVRSAQAGSNAKGIVPLPARLEPSGLWMPSTTGSPKPHVQDGVEVEVCAPCHSRREPLKEGFLADDPFLDSFEPELLSPGRYHADGQVEGEVYEWGSFLQSRMYKAGVRCSDCHDSHSGKPHAEGNNLCVRCHEPERFNVEAHSHHAAGKVLCVDCHMPPSTFMQVDERRDHSIRIPRPDHSVSFGTPNACNGCHRKESARWAQAHVGKWFPASAARPHFVDALAKERKGTLDAPRALRMVAQDDKFPSIARASALERLGQYPTAQATETLKLGLMSSESLVVYGAVLGSAQLPLAQRVALLVPALEHPARAVRIAAAKNLAGASATQLPESARAALERAFEEVTQSFAVSASRAESHVERSAFALARGQLAEAEEALHTALALQPCLPEAHLNLADIARQRRDEAAAERAIRSALDCSPDSAAAHHALGLWQVRARQPTPALASLTKAVELAPSDVRFAYVLAIALNSSGRRSEAIRVLESALQSRPNDTSVLQALAGFLQQDGQNERSSELRRVLNALLRE